MDNRIDSIILRKLKPRDHGVKFYRVNIITNQNELAAFLVNSGNVLKEDVDIVLVSIDDKLSNEPWGARQQHAIQHPKPH